MTNGREPLVTNTYTNDTLDISLIVLTESQLHRRKTFTKNPNARNGLNPIRALGFVARAAGAIR